MKFSINGKRSVIGLSSSTFPLAQSIRTITTAYSNENGRIAPDVESFLKDLDKDMRKVILYDCRERFHFTAGTEEGSARVVATQSVARPSSRATAEPCSSSFGIRGNEMRKSTPTGKGWEQKVKSQTNAPLVTKLGCEVSKCKGFSDLLIL